VGRGEPDPLQPLDRTDVAQELGEVAVAGEVAAVGVDVLPEQRHLDDAVGDQPTDLLDDVVRAAGHLRAAQRGDDAERAAVVAPDADRDPRVVADLALGGQGAGERLQGLHELDDRHFGRVGGGQQLRQRSDVVGAVDHVDPRGPVDDLRAVLLGEAATDRDREVAALGAACVLGRLRCPSVPYSLLSAFSRTAQVLSRTRSASVSSAAARQPIDSSRPATRPESWAFIWHPKVRIV
jgi:hypothetical protein